MYMQENPSCVWVQFNLKCIFTSKFITITRCPHKIVDVAKQKPNEMFLLHAFTSSYENYLYHLYISYIFFINAADLKHHSTIPE